MNRDQHPAWLKKKVKGGRKWYLSPQAPQTNVTRNLAILLRQGFAPVATAHPTSGAGGETLLMGHGSITASSEQRQPKCPNMGWAGPDHQHVCWRTGHKAEHGEPAPTLPLQPPLFGVLLQFTEGNESCYQDSTYPT